MRAATAWCRPGARRTRCSRPRHPGLRRPTSPQARNLWSRRKSNKRAAWGTTQRLRRAPDPGVQLRKLSDAGRLREDGESLISTHASRYRPSRQGRWARAEQRSDWAPRSCRIEGPVRVRVGALKQHDGITVPAGLDWRGVRGTYLTHGAVMVGRPSADVPTTVQVLETFTFASLRLHRRMPQRKKSAGNDRYKPAQAMQPTPNFSHLLTALAVLFAKHPRHPDVGGK